MTRRDLAIVMFKEDKSISAEQHQKLYKLQPAEIEETEEKIRKYATESIKELKWMENPEFKDRFKVDAMPNINLEEQLKGSEVKKVWKGLATQKTADGSESSLTVYVIEIETEETEEDFSTDDFCSDIYDELDGVTPEDYEIDLDDLDDEGIDIEFDDLSDI